MIVTPTETTKYSLITHGTVSDTAEVTLTYYPPGRVKSFTASPYFLDQGSNDSTTLSWTTTKGSLVTLDGLSVDTNGSKTVAPGGTHTYNLVASGEEQDTARVTITFLPSDQINRAYIHPVQAYGVKRGYQAGWAVDGDTITPWISNTGTTWIQVDLGRYYNINRVVLNWGNIFSNEYYLYIPDSSGSMTKKIYTNMAGDGGVDDISGLSGNARYIRLKSISSTKPDSGYIVLKEFEVYATKLSSTGIEQAIQSLPVRFDLAQNYPNPFNPTTSIAYDIPDERYVSLKVYNTVGQEVASMVNAKQQAGHYAVNFDAKHLASGLYLYRLTAGTSVSVKKMVLIK